MKLFCAARILPIGRPPIENGALLVRGGGIEAVGKRREVETPAGTEIVDFGDAVLLPPMANAHTHLELTHFPRWASEMGEEDRPASFVDWVLKVIRVKRRVALPRFLPSLEEGIRHSLAAGTGAVGDILSCFPARKAYRGATLTGKFFLETLGRDPVNNRRILRGIGEILHEGTVGEMTPGISPHSPYSLSEEYLEEVFGYARRHDAPLCTHFAESREEISFLAEGTGPIADTLFPFVGWGDMVPPPPRRTPAAFLRDRGGLKARALLVHGVQVTPGDVDLLAESGSTVVLCPRSNARLGVGRAPVEIYLRAGVPLALGTDSLASCDSLSLWDEVAFASSFFGGAIPPRDLLRMATLQGARALGLERRMGSLEKGRGASFQVLRPSHLCAAGDLEEMLCAEGNRGEVLALFLDGRDLLQKN